MDKQASAPTYEKGELLFTSRDVFDAATGRRVRESTALKGTPKPGTFIRFMGTVVVELPSDLAQVMKQQAVPVEINLDGPEPDKQTLEGAFALLDQLWSTVTKNVVNKVREQVLAAGGNMQAPKGWMDQFRTGKPHRKN